MGWGIKAYVVWFGISNFFVPFVILVFCYTRICYVIWENFNSKTIALEEDNSEKKISRYKDKIHKAFSTSNGNWLSRRKNTNPHHPSEEDGTGSKFQGAENFRVNNERSLGKMEWQKHNDCNGKLI